MEIHTLAENVFGNDVDTASDKSLSNELFANNLYKIESDAKLMKERPWRKDAKYFRKAYISSLALIKMTLHATSGGSIEIMGMMTGKIIEGSIVVMDVYPLPVEGTETRVNAQAEGYEYMVQYLEQLKRVDRKEHIVGWYHSHPGYGCWLSGIDVATQSLNQNFQDPYLAIVVDPLKTKSQGIVEIGAFRTYPENFRNKSKNKDASQENRRLPKEKRQDFGAHYEDYYSLDVEIFKSKNDRKIIDLLLKESWRSGILLLDENDRESEKEGISKIAEKIEKNRANLPSRQLHVIEQTLLKKFAGNFEAEMKEKLLRNRGSSIRFSEEEDAEDEDEEMSDESDLEVEQGNLLDVSDIDVDDAMSMDSASAVLRNKRNDYSDIEDDDLDGDHTPQSSSASGSLGATEIDLLRTMRQRKIQRRKFGLGSRGQVLRKNQQQQQQYQIRLHQQEQRRLQKDMENSLSTLRPLNLMQTGQGDHETKDANSRTNDELQALGNQIGLNALEYLLTLRAQQKIFGGD